MVGRGALGLGFRDWAVSRVDLSSLRDGCLLWSARRRNRGTGDWLALIRGRRLNGRRSGAWLVRRGQGGPGHVSRLVRAAAARVDTSHWAVGRVDRSSFRDGRLQRSAGCLGGRGSRAWLVRRGQGGPGHVGSLVCAAAARVNAGYWAVGRVDRSSFRDGRLQWSASRLRGRGSRAWLVGRSQRRPGHVGSLVCAAAARVDTSYWAVGRVNCGSFRDSSIAGHGRAGALSVNPWSWRRCRLGDWTDGGTNSDLRVMLAAVLSNAS